MIEIDAEKIIDNAIEDLLNANDNITKFPHTVSLTIGIICERLEWLKTAIVNKSENENV